jgi:hypothetical protein
VQSGGGFRNSGIIRKKKYKERYGEKNVENNFINTFLEPDLQPINTVFLL